MKKIGFIIFVFLLVRCSKTGASNEGKPFSPPMCGPVYPDTVSFDVHSGGVTLIECVNNTQWGIDINDTSLTGNDTIGHFTLALYDKDNYYYDFNLNLGEEQTITFMSTKWQIKWIKVYPDTIRDYGDPLFPETTPLVTWGVELNAKFAN